MTVFKTQIVEARKTPLLLRLIIAGALLVSAFLLYIDKSLLGTSMRIVVSIVYMLAMIFAFGINFLKPRNRGELKIDAEEIYIQLSGKEKIINASCVQNLQLNYRTYGGWWSYNFYGNDNVLSFTTSEGEDYNLEIILRDKKHKESFKKILSLYKPLVTTKGLSIGRAAF